MRLHDLRPAEGSRRNRKRVGRGIGSGMGKTSARGQKGQKSRTGGNPRPGFEGGQMPLTRRLPKVGFTNIFKKEYEVINISALDRFDNGCVITPEVLEKAGMVNNKKDGIKILGNGDITKKFTVKANKFSKTAVEKIESAGGKAEVI